MGQESGDGGGKPRPTTGTHAALSADEVRAFQERAPRCTVSVAVVCTPAGPDGVVTTERWDAELVNLSSSGMLLTSSRPVAVGAMVEFEFTLDEGMVALAGSAEVVRRQENPPGFGLRFVTLDAAARELVARLVALGAPSGGGLVEAAPVEYGPGTIRVRLTADTAVYFTYNPLLHVGVGGCFLPSDRDVPLGTGYQLDIVADDGRLVLRCKAKVAAKQERRIGLRLVDVERDALAALRAEVARMSSRQPVVPRSKA